MRGGVVALLVVWGAAQARADGEPTPAPADASWYASAPPPTASPDVRVRHPVMRDGAFVLGGTTRADGHMFGRIDLGLPTPSRRLRGLRTLLVTELQASTEESIEMRTFAISPTLQYDWRLPMSLAGGELVVIAAAGIERAQLWQRRPDEPFWPAKWESITEYAFRFTLGVEYRSRKGLVVSAQPLIAQLPTGEPESPDPRWVIMERETTYGAAVVAGYQFK